MQATSSDCPLIQSGPTPERCSKGRSFKVGQPQNVAASTFRSAIPSGNVIDRIHEALLIPKNCFTVSSTLCRHCVYTALQSTSSVTKTRSKKHVCGSCGVLAPLGIARFVAKPSKGRTQLLAFQGRIPIAPESLQGRCSICMKFSPVSHAHVRPKRKHEYVGQHWIAFVCSKIRRHRWLSPHVVHVRCVANFFQDP